MNRPASFLKRIIILLPSDISSPRIHLRDTSFQIYDALELAWFLELYQARQTAENGVLGICKI